MFPLKHERSCPCGAGYAILLSRPPSAERYRSGRNGIASKAICRVTGTWVRIPPSPPTFAKRSLREQLRLASPTVGATCAPEPLTE